MTSAAWILLAVAGGFAVGNWVAVAVGSKPAEYVCKPATIALLIAVALTLDPVHGDTRTWFVVALALSLLGDVFLMLPTRPLRLRSRRVSPRPRRVHRGPEPAHRGQLALAIPVPIVAAVPGGPARARESGRPVRTGSSGRCSRTSW